MQESGGCVRSSLNPSAQRPSHIMSGKSQRSSQGTLPPRKEIVRMKTVKTVLHIYFFLEGFKPLKTSSGKKCKCNRSKRQRIPVPNLQLRSSSQAVKVTPCKGMIWYVNIVYKCIYKHMKTI